MNVDAWYVAEIRSRWEERARVALETKGYRVLLPLVRCLSRPGHPNARNSQPMFPGYLFFSLRNSFDGKVVTTPGVLGVIAFAGQWAAVDQRQIEALQITTQRLVPQYACPYRASGEWVRVESGPLRGVEGWVVENSKRLVICISLIQRAMAVTFDENTIISKVSRGKSPSLSFASAQQIPNCDGRG